MNKLQLTLALCALSGLLATSAQAEDWQLAKDEAGIKVYLSTMAGSQYKAYRAVTTINADISSSAGHAGGCKGILCLDF